MRRVSRRGRRIRPLGFRRAHAVDPCGAALQRAGARIHNQGARAAVSVGAWLGLLLASTRPRRQRLQREHDPTLIGIVRHAGRLTHRRLGPSKISEQVGLRGCDEGLCVTARGAVRVVCNELALRARVGVGGVVGRRFRRRGSTAGVCGHHFELHTEMSGLRLTTSSMSNMRHLYELRVTSFNQFKQSNVPRERNANTIKRTLTLTRTRVITKAAAPNLCGM